MYLQMFGHLAMFYSISSGKSLGCGEVNLNLKSGKALAEIYNNSPNLTPGLFLSLNVSLNPSEFWCYEDASVLEVSL